MKLILIAGMLSIVVPARSNAESEWGGTINLSLGTASTSTYAQILVTDPLGRKSGFVADGKIVLDIPGSNYVAESVDDYSGANKGNESVVFLVNDPIAGQYNFVVVGLANTKYSFQIHAEDSDGKEVISYADIHSGIISSGMTQQYVLNYTPASGGVSSVGKTINFAGLRNDVTIAEKLNELGAEKFVKSLVKNIDLSEKLYAVCDKRKTPKAKGCEPAVDVLRLFVKRLELANRKCDSAGGCDEGPELAAFEKAHRGDRDYDDFFRAWDKDDWHKSKKTSKRFVTDEALSIIRGDAEVLIKTLEPSPKGPGKH